MESERTVAGPTRHFVDGQGRYRGEFHDAVDAKGTVVAAVKVPADHVEVIGPPPGPGYLWRGGTWVVDPSYEPPVKPPSVDERLSAIETRLIAIEAQLGDGRGTKS